MKDSLPLYKQIAKDLREKIVQGKLRPGDRLPSENQLAKEYHVSVITSKTALNELAEQQLIVRKKGYGSFVRVPDPSPISSQMPLYKGLIGIICPTLSMPLESGLLYYIQSNLILKKYQTLICMTDDIMNKEVNAIRTYRFFGIKGLILFPASGEHYNDEILRLAIDRFPNVMVDRYLPKLSNSYVITDNRDSVEKIMKHLKGHRLNNIGFISVNSMDTNTMERMSSFEDFLARNNTPIDRSLFFIREHNQSYSDTIESLMKYFTINRHLTAVIAVNVSMASLTYSALMKLGRHIPEDVEIVSFDDPKLPYVSFIEQDIKKIAETAVGILIDQIETKYETTTCKIPATFRKVTYPIPFGLFELIPR